MYYSISEVSKQLNISKVTIYKKIAKLNELTPHVKKLKDGQCISEEGIEIIKKSMEVNQSSKPLQPEFKDNTQNKVSETELTAYKLLINTLQDQIKIKDEQINNLSRLLENSQVLQRKQKLLEDKPHKLPVWKRFFN